MALIDLTIRPGYIGGSYGILRVTLGRVSLEGWTMHLDGEERFVWFEGLRREAWFELDGTWRWMPNQLLDTRDSIAGFKVME